MQIEDAPFTLETALELYDLKHTEMLWQKEPTDTKCLLAWVRMLFVFFGVWHPGAYCGVCLAMPPTLHVACAPGYMLSMWKGLVMEYFLHSSQGDGIIVIGFRGTASMANVLADIKVRCWHTMPNNSVPVCTSSCL